MNETPGKLNRPFFVTCHHVFFSYCNTTHLYSGWAWFVVAPPLAVVAVLEHKGGDERIDDVSALGLQRCHPLSASELHLEWMNEDLKGHPHKKAISCHRIFPIGGPLSLLKNNEKA